MSDLEITGKPGQDVSAKRAANDDRTIVISQPPVADKTIVVNSRNFDRSNDDEGIFRTSRVKELSSVEIPDEYASNDNCFLLKGDYYKLVSTLSENSGEAQVYLVERNGLQYVLKIYYPNYDINKKLMQIIHNFQFEMIVKLYDFGKTYVDGKRRSYELMEYLQGGTLQDIHIGGDYNKFRRIALQTAAALAYCHQNNILHKDIKPSNFFFRDATHTQVVLGDFGISSLVEKDGKTYRTTQARTPVYAAPEMYVDVIDGEVEVTPAADYYSLGITLFATWLGENPMSSNERDMMRQKSEGRLPRMEELPPRVKRIIQGLTAVNAMTRWKYSEVERWFLGEDVPIDESSPFLRYKSFIVDPDRNLVADNIKELVPMLLDNEPLAINYLYNGRIVSWLEACGNMKLSTVVKDIITNRYPVDKKAGLMASVYLMDPSYNYRDVLGEVCDDIHSIALSLLSHKDRYAMELQNPNDSLFLWLETHTKVNVNRLRTYFTPDAEPHVAVMRMVYEIDADIPFLANHASANLKEIVNSFGYASPTDDDWHSLIDGRLLSWMYCHEDIMACESLKIMIQGQPFSMALAYKVLYNLDRTAAYDLREANTPEAVGQLLCEQLQTMQHTPNADLALQMQDFLDEKGRFFYYAELQGWYQLVADAKHCFDMNAPENVERLSAYDMHTAFYRFCLILGVTPVYLLPNGVELRGLDDLKDTQNAMHMRNEMRTGSLSQWMAAFYHENPHKDFSEEYSYEKELERWVLALGEIDAQQKYYRRFIKARQDTAERVNDVRHEWRSARFREQIWKYLYYGLLTIWMGLLLFVGIDDPSRVLSHPYFTIMAPLGLMTGIIIAIRLFFNGIGPLLSILLGIVGASTAFVPMWLLQLVGHYKPSMFTATIVILTIIYAIICQLTRFRRDDKTSVKTVREILMNEDVNSALLEPLYYTFKTKSIRYKSTKFSLLDDISNQLRSISGENVIHYILWGLLVLIMIAEFYFFSPRFLSKEITIEEDQTEQTVDEEQYDFIK